jgi:hypothetical protein
MPYTNTNVETVEMLAQCLRPARLGLPYLPRVANKPTSKSYLRPWSMDSPGIDHHIELVDLTAMRRETNLNRLGGPLYI